MGSSLEKLQLKVGKKKVLQVVAGGDVILRESSQGKNLELTGVVCVFGT